MTTILDLTRNLAAALGMRQRAVEFAAGDLHEAGLIRALDEEADAETLARLLIAAVADFSVSPPHQVVVSFWNLPLVTVEQMIQMAGVVSWELVPQDNLLTQDLRAYLGPTFGAALKKQIESALDPDNALFGFGTVAFTLGVKGQETSMGVQITTGDAIAVSAMVWWFSEAARNPDGNAPAQPSRTVELPSTIFNIVPEILGAGTPRALGADQSLEDEVAATWGVEEDARA